ncbi:MAG: DUF2313 domain-containing protein [Desulforudis sp.]|jgi:uncharacterized protein YmfQ (DUF2313 family)|nr:MAG: DUF2313 domain-containing protein [Desulforudis sp.]
MVRTVADYLKMLWALMPRGRAWSRDQSSVMNQVLHALAEELARVDSRAAELFSERDTRQAFELLPEHEYDLGLPDECSGEAETITERRRRAHAKLIALGGLHKQYYIDLASALGYTIAIEEFTPFWSGVGLSGDPAGDQWVIFCWKVKVYYLSGQIIWLQSGAGESGDPICYVPAADSLVCVLQKYKPAHTRILWEYVGPALDRSFSRAFDAIPADEEWWLDGAFDRAFATAFDVYFGGAFTRDAFDDAFNHPG